MDKVKLYIGGCMSDLNKKATYNFDSGRSTRIHINHAEKTFQAAEEARLKGDEERGYILYMRYLDIFQKVRQSRDYKKDESHFSLLLGTSKFADAIAKAEQLSKSLKIRYEEKESGGKICEKDSKKTNGTTGVKSLANSAHGISEQSSKPAKEVSQTGLELIPKDAKSITAQKLYELLFGNRMTGVKVLMMDIRGPEEFKESCIRHPSCINVPKTHIKPGTITRKVEAGIKNIDHIDEWKNRALADVIVMIDWSGNEKRLNDIKDPLRSLKDALSKWDQETFLKREPVVLTGGYVDWLDYFPQFTTNPKVQRPSNKPKNITSVSSLIDFSFNDLITPESKVSPENDTPAFDDAKKEESDDWDNAEYLETKKAPNSPVISAQQSPKIPAAAPENSVGLNPTVPNDISLGGVANEKKPVQERADEKSATVSSEAAKKMKKNIPSVDRSTKPVMPSRTLKPQTNSEKPDVAEVDISSIKQTQQWPPAAFTDVTEQPTESAKKPEEYVDKQTFEDPEVVAMRERIEKMKKRKEESELKMKEIEEKKKFAELQAMEKRMLEEVEEQERQRKQAEKELAERMRELAKPIKPNTEKEAGNRKGTEKPSSVLESPSSPAKPANTSTMATEEKAHVLSVPRNKKPLEKDKDNEVPVAAKSKDVPSNEPVHATVSKPKPASSADSRPTVKTADKVDAVMGKDVTKSEHAHTAKTTKPDPAADKPPVKKNEIPKNEARKPSSPKPAPVSKQVEPTKGTESTKMPVQVNKPQAPAKNVPSDPYASKKLIKTNDVKPAMDKTQPKRAQVKSLGEIPASSASVTRKGSANLPINWEKRLDSRTGRYFFLDHNTQTTHWMLPSNVVANNPVKKAPLKDESASTGGSLKRSRSTPNIAELIEEEEKSSQRPKPVIPNRNFKPSTVPEAVPDPPDVYTERLLRLHPVGGGPGPGLCGLQNLGNTCYMNSVLQCMFNTTLLTEYFLKNLYKRDINRENFLGSGGEITDGFATVLKAVWEGKYRHLTPRDFRHTISKFNPRFGGYIQQDSQELLLFLMDGLHEDLNRITKRKYVEEEDNDHLNDATAADIAWKYHKTLNESIIVELFQGQFKATVQCLHCRKTSRKFDVFMYLSLPISSHSSSIHECIQNFSKEEKLSGDNKWRCPACKCERDAVRKMEIWKLPPVLLIHFKRFSFSGRWRDKIQTSVSFPEKGLDMNKYAKGGYSKKAYNLYSVSHHHGASLDSGHYVASCKSPLDGNWYKYDDHEVLKTSVPQGPSAYILCYTSLEHSIRMVSAAK